MANENIFQRALSFTKELFKNYMDDDALNLGAALAYYTVFSFAPLLVVATTVASYFFGEEAVSGNLYGELKNLLGPDSAETIQEIVSNAYQSGDSWWATAISIGTLVFAATGVFANLQISMNKIWELRAAPENGVLGFVFKRLLSFSFVIGLGFLLVVTLVLNTIVLGFMDKIVELVPGISEVLLAVGTWVLSTVITAVVFALMFRYLPDAKARWRDIWVGALFTSILFGLGRILIGFYIGNSDFSSTYGAAGALITLLVWTYYNSQILFLGAEFTFIWAARSGNPILPDDHAVKIRTKEVKLTEEQVIKEAEKTRVDTSGKGKTKHDATAEKGKGIKGRPTVDDDPDRISQRPVG
ncbi:YihY/virulence factor BrkB family protein [Neolewinella antarctica]|uniref:Membrane protein n=1 Tax=Neolewinella antarctica TaxID=442734 RepID=A0ABX0XB81_9BACT|nr:YihY/virulence factor BrkB family protein [Neolewinella antarctica]NJC26189.1 membrane protein [Neolewinella antarctica]